MEGGSYKLLESATHRTLHAHSFSRASSQASHVLTDLLSRYLALLSSTCVKYAQHAGRTGLTPRDAISVLDELGLGLEELSEYCSSEGRELGRYAIHSARRVEDMNEFRAQLADGIRQDRDDAIPLHYELYDPPSSDEDEDEPGDDDTVEQVSMVDTAMDVDMPPRSTVLGKNLEPPRRITPPPLPLSSISNLSPPSYKRSRTASWQPPPHIPDYLPPFPTTIDSPPSPDLVPSPQRDQFELPSAQTIDRKVEKPQLSLAQTITSSSSASDYLVQVPYPQSTLSGVAEWHLPSAHPTSKSASTRQPRLPTPQTEQALFTAYHHILTHPPPSNGNSPTPLRHRVAMALLSQIQMTPRWEAPDTLYSSVAPCPPRVAAIGPTYPMVIGDNGSDSKSKAEKDVKVPPAIPRPVSSSERLTPLISQQPSRIPELARHALPPAIFARTSRLSHPPVLQRGSKLLLYGPGIPAPWNANSPTSAETVPPVSAKSKDGANGTAGKSEDLLLKPTLPDARLYATWDYESKDPMIPLGSTMRTRGRMGSVQGGPGVISLALGSRGKSKNN